MNWLSTRMRISIGLACLTLSVLLLSMLIGVLPDREKAVLEGRRTLCEAIAVNSSILVSQQDLARLHAVLKVTADRNPDILSAAVRRDDGKLLVEVGEHRAQWKPLDDRHSIDTQVQVPIHAGDKRWGSVEIRFRPLSQAGMTGLFFGPRPRLLWFVCSSCFVLFFLYMKKMLEYLDPSQAVPEHVRSALDTLAEGLLVIDGRDRIVLANGAFAAMVGKSPDKLLGHVASRLPWVHGKENEPPAALPWTIAMREKTAKTNVMLRLQTVGGGLRTFIVNSSPVLGSKGEYRGVLASFDDVTDLEEKELELRKAVASADAANRTKSEFLANMSHEIRTPMNAILGFTDVLRRGFAADEQTRQHYLDTIHSSGKHLLDLINDILDLSKIEAGRLEVERTACSPCELIAELVAMFGVPAQNRGISLEFITAGPVPETILTDPTRFRQIIANLVGNAIKFTETGGVKIVARLLSHGEKPQLAIDVIDTGIGISPEGLGKIFEPFVQADSAVTRRFGGTGLGLTISRRFAAALGGELTVASELGRGSTFTVTLDTGPLDGIRLLDAPQAKTFPALPGSRFRQEPAETAAGPRPGRRRRRGEPPIDHGHPHPRRSPSGDCGKWRGGRADGHQPTLRPDPDGYANAGHGRLYGHHEAASTRTVDSDRGTHGQRHARSGGQMQRRRLLRVCRQARGYRRTDALSGRTAQGNRRGEPGAQPGGRGVLFPRRFRHLAKQLTRENKVTRLIFRCLHRCLRRGVPRDADHPWYPACRWTIPNSGRSSRDSSNASASRRSRCRPRGSKGISLNWRVCRIGSRERAGPWDSTLSPNRQRRWNCSPSKNKWTRSAMHSAKCST